MTDPRPDDPALRRRIMQSNRRRDTKPEMEIRSSLHARGLRFRVDFPIRLAGHRPVRPDVVFTRKRLAVFVDGCFWHGCPQHATWPKANADWWREKITANRARDVRVTRLLEESGWTVVRVWEHETVESATDRIARAVLDGRSSDRSPSADP